MKVCIRLLIKIGLNECVSDYVLVVFQYTFKIPGEDKEWIVMWDYNIGLVRITHLFKCNEYSKVCASSIPSLGPVLTMTDHAW